MSITGMAQRSITVRRVTALVLDQVTVASPHSLDRQPAKAAHMEVEVSGGSGTVTIFGTVGGAPDSEVLTFTGAQAGLVTTKRFSAVDASGVVVTGLAGETIKITATGADGSRIESAAGSIRVAQYHAPAAPESSSSSRRLIRAT